ncbi:MAG: BatA and WFA domain-containing protein [Planctomycetaceae bacterium]|jgi:hypothetical protein|nr:BatA and WFA domain-containing protein [Phycisphaerales bacterium]MCE2652491.1 BatA and WFA domain-containing protein [Planctomycetaceae bacterium]
MNFLTPGLAAIVAGIAVPSLLILYFLRLRRRDVEVSSTLLWKKAIEDLQANAPFQRLRRNILLLLQLLVLAAALLALAQPQFVGSLGGGERHIIMIDRSASMQSVDGEPDDATGGTTRLDAAKKAALELVDRLREPGLVGSTLGSVGDQAMVIAFDQQAERLASFTGNKAELRRAINSITATDAPSRLKPAVLLAKAHLPRRVHVDDRAAQSVTFDELYEGGATMHIYSDGNLPDAPEVRTQAEDSITFTPAGQRTAWNVGITGLRAERSFDRPANVALFVGLQSTRPEPVRVEVQLSIEGRVAEIRDVTLPAAVVEAAAAPVAPAGAAPAEGEAAANAAGADGPRLTPVNRGVVFNLDRPDGALVAVQLRFPGAPAGGLGDALPVDNLGYLVLPPARRLNVAMVTPGNPFLEAVFVDDPAGAQAAFNLARPVRVVRPADAQTFLGTAEAAELDVLILDRWLPTAPGPDGKQSPTLPTGNTIVFGAVPAPPLGPTDQGEAKDIAVVDWKRDHPVLRGLNLDPVAISPGRKLELTPESPARSLMLGTAGPLLLEYADVDRRALVVTFDPIFRSTWIYEPTLPAFIAKAFDYLGRGGEQQRATLRPGDTLTARLPRGVADVRVALPDERESPLLPSPGGEVNFAPLEQIGVYTVSWDGPLGPTDVLVGGRARRAMTVNLLDAAESDVATRAALPMASTLVQATPTDGRGPMRLWPWLLLLGVLIVLLEWWVYNRKVSL